MLKIAQNLKSIINTFKIFFSLKKASKGWSILLLNRILTYFIKIIKFNLFDIIEKQ